MQSMKSTNHNPASADTLQPLIKRRTPLAHTNVPFIVCWAQKSGCTATLKWFLHHAGLLDEAATYKSGNMRLGIHSYENKVFKARPGYKNELIASLRSGKPAINFMRCPFERVFSSYMILNNSRFPDMVIQDVITPGIRIRQAVLEFIYGESGEFTRPVSFRQYLLWLRQQDLDTLEPHHAPQNSPLYRHIRVRHFRLDDFDVATSQLEAEFSMDNTSSSQHAFSSGHHRRKRDVPIPDSLAFLDNGLPLDRFPLDALPRVNRALLAGSWFETMIGEILAEDIALYDTIPTLDQATA